MGLTHCCVPHSFQMPWIYEQISSCYFLCFMSLVWDLMCGPGELCKEAGGTRFSATAMVLALSFPSTHTSWAGWFHPLLTPWGAGLCWDPAQHHTIKLGAPNSIPILLSLANAVFMLELTLADLPLLVLLGLFACSRCCVCNTLRRGGA